MTTTTNAATSADPTTSARPRAAVPAGGPAPAEPSDVVDHLLGVRPGDRLDQIRSARPEARVNAQKAYEALLDPVDESEFSRAERLAVATFVVGLHGAEDVREFYAARLAAVESGSDVVAAVDEESARGRGAGPYGVYREPGLAGESTRGPAYRVESRSALGGRLAAALEHAHLLVLRPREATPEEMERLLAAGWSTTGIVTLSQLVAFLAFQVRVVHGLRQLAVVESEGAR
ncbi:CMD domain protein [Georgenia sp. EYE_87]|uniref:CMD domain protein n=1 Tax=Georgenia sp. EYE_87 TaxID=2853448 RepID=UPI002003F023|nr:CMD domain protein [Georgenia sp. EYE_87]MCK6211946.1 CMD domain protein [Georgenia sp. EYE_87]